MKIRPRSAAPPAPVKVPAVAPASSTAAAAAPAVKHVALELTPTEGRPVTGPHAALGWSTRGYWLEQTLLKPPVETNIPLDDVEGSPPTLGVELPPLLPEDGRQAVYQKLAKVPLERMLVGAGYRYYRHPEDFPAVLAQVKANNSVDTRPSIIDVHTDGHGRVTNVDLDSHHLRMAAYLETGARTLSDLPFDQVLIKVDGRQREDDKVWPMKVHGYALPTAVLLREGVHLSTDQTDPATVEIHNLPNWELGSRTTLGRFHQTLLHREQPKVGLVEGGGELVARALKLKAERGLDEVVLVPSGRPDEALLETVRATDGLNLYLDHPASLRAHFPGLDYATLVKYRLNQLYGVDLHAIVTE